MPRKRPDKHAYYLNIAKEMAKRGTCLRRNYAAIIIKDDAIISSGYTGAPRGMPNCIDLNSCIREELKIKPQTHYELCKSVHAEMNAIINAARTGVNIFGGTMYVYGEESDGSLANTASCKLCKRMLINSGIKEVVRLDKEGEMVLEPLEKISLLLKEEEAKKF